MAPVSQITPDGNAGAADSGRAAAHLDSRPEADRGRRSTMAKSPRTGVRNTRRRSQLPLREGNVRSPYEGKGGFPDFLVPPMRLAPALVEGEPNILLTGTISPATAA